MYVTSPYFDAEPIHFSDAVAAGGAPSRYCERTVAPRTVVFHEGDACDVYHEVASGVLRMTKLLADGRRQVVSFALPGDIVGFSPDRVNHCDCEALTEARLRVIRRQDIANDPGAFERLLACAAAEVAGMQEHFILLGRKCAMEKVASFLVALARRTGHHDECGHEICFDLPMSRTDIADFLGLTIETVSRTLTKLRTAGIITLPEPHHVCVASVERLEAVAERDE